VLRTPQNNKEEGARAKKLVTCGTRGPLGRGQSVPSVPFGFVLVRVLPRERGGCAKNSENSGRSRIVRRKGVKSRDRGSLDVYDASKTEVASSEVQISARKIHPAVKRGR